MMRLSFAALLAAVEGRIVTVQQVTTAAPSTILATQSLAVVTDQATAYASETIFKASTIVTTIPTGTVNTSPLSSKEPPVSQTDTYSTSELSATVNPESYTNGFTIVSPTLASEPTGAPAATSSSAAESTSTSSPASPNSAATSSSSSYVSASSASTTASSSGASTVTTSNSEPWKASSSSTGSTTSSGSSSSIAATTSSSSAAAATSSAAPAPPSGGKSSYSGPIFNPVDTAEPLSMFKREPIPLNLPSGVDTSGIVQTNKFYDNFLLNDQDLTAFAQPYGVFYSADKSYYGLGISYTNASQRVFGPNPDANPVEYYTNPVGLMSLVLSAKEFTSADLNKPKVDGMGPFSANVTLTTQNSWPNQAVTIPVVQGMGFVTAVYDGYTPRLFSQLGIEQIVKVKSSNCDPDLQKYAVSLMNGVQWNVYVNGPDDFEFKAVSDYEVMGSTAASGADSIIVQVAVVPSNEESIDKAAGAFPVGAEIDGEVGGSSATYRIAYDVRGKSTSGTTLLYALPHHVASFSGSTQPNVVSDLTVYSTNKGYLTGVLDNKLEMVEDLSGSPDWLPTNTSSVSADTLKLLSTVLNDELSEDIKGQVDTTSTYTAGKSFDKFAYIALVAKLILGNDDVAKQGLDKLKDALSPWLSNTQPTPFIYDTLCKGVTSSAANQPGGKPMDDFGAPFYNDHHFHYGYYVHTAAVIGLLDNEVGDGTWVQQNKDWVNSLVRDVANPSAEDQYFPVSRMFDFFSGHSWAHGMFQSGDGKDEESTSEDYNFAYGMKLWGRVLGDHQMEARGDLMLAILRRSLNSYFLFEDNNTIQPSNIIANRVAGITFENKLDHTTYFGTNLEYIQGIQMLPLTPASVLIRKKEFVQQEWDSLLANIVGGLQSGWAGVLRANQALFDPQASYQYFASNNFKTQYLDGGASRTWYLAFAALLGGNPN